MSTSWRDPKFVYHGVASHADPTAFARRQKARQRTAQEAAKACEDERAAKVRPIAGRTRKVAT